MNQELKHFRKYCRTMRHEAQGESGIALIFAIGFLAVLMVIGLGFAANSLVAGKIAKNSNHRTQATVLADSALTQAKLTLQESFASPSIYGYDLNQIYSQDSSKRFVNYRTNYGLEDSVSYDNGTYKWGKDDDAKSNDAYASNRDYQTFLDTFQIKVDGTDVYKVEDMEDYQKFVPTAARRNTSRESRFAWHYITVPVDNSSIVRDDKNEDKYSEEEEQFTQIIGRIAYMALPPVNKLDIVATSNDAAAKMASRLKDFDSVKDDQQKVINFAQQFNLSEFKEDFLFGTGTNLDAVLPPPERAPETANDPLSCYLANRWISYEQFYSSMYDGYKPSALKDHKNAAWSYFDFAGTPRPEAYWYDKDSNRKITESELYPRFDLSAELFCGSGDHTHTDECVAKFLDSTNITAIERKNNAFDAAKTLQYFRIIGATPRSFKSMKALRSQIVANFLDYQDTDDLPASGVIANEDQTGDIQACPPSSWRPKENTADNGNMPDFTGNERSWYLSALDSTVYCDVDIERSSSDGTLTASLAVNAAVQPHLYYMFDYQDEKYSEFNEEKAGGNLKKAANCEVQVTGQLSLVCKFGPLPPHNKQIPFSQTVKISTTASGANFANGISEFKVNLDLNNVPITEGSPFLVSVYLTDVELYDMILTQDGKQVDCSKLRASLLTQNVNKQIENYPTFQEAYNVTMNTPNFSGAQLAPSSPMLPDDQTGMLPGNVDISGWTEGNHRGNQIVFRTLCSDPRQNLNPGDWQPLNWKNWNSTENYLPHDTTGDRETDITAWITNRPMQTAAEFGRIHRGAQWETINLRACGSSPVDYKPDADLNAEGISYKMGDAGILDQVTEIFGSGYRFGTWDPNFAEPVIYDGKNLQYSSPLLKSILKGSFKDDALLSLAQSLTYGIASDTSLSSDLELRPFNRVKQFRKRPAKSETGNTVAFTQDEETGSDSVFRSISVLPLGSGKKFLLNRAALADQAVYLPGTTDTITTFSNVVREVAGKSFTKGNKMQQEAVLSKLLMTAETGYFPTTVQVLVVAQSIHDVGALNDENIYADEDPVGLPLTLVSSKGNNITQDCVMGQFDYYYDGDTGDEVYFDEITGEVKMLATFTRDIWTNEWKISDIQYLQ